MDPLEEDHLDIKGDIISALELIKSTGSILTSGNLNSGVNPGLYVPSSGLIRLPISPEDAQSMIQSCHMSPYGKGTETLVDESVRKCWQLASNEFSLRNPLWRAQMGVLVSQAVAGLGLKADSPEVKAELYKLLIYEEGAFFLPHQDSEKADGMFGTLVVCLPSKHEGGSVIASHRDNHLKFHTAPNSEFGFSWAAWYADVTHEVKPVTSGYRIALVYNLIHRPSAALLGFHGSKTERLTHLFERWARAAEEPMQYLDGWDDRFNEACPPALVYILEHQYTSAELNCARLKGVDQSRFAELQNACKRTGFDIFLANIEKENMGGVDDGYYDSYYGRGRYGSDDIHSIVDLIESTLKLSRVVNTKGIVVGKNLPFPEKMLIQEDVFNRDPDKENFQGFTGNEGATATYFYQETGVLVIPKKFHFLFMLHQSKHGQGDIIQLLENCHRVISEQPNDMAARQNLLQVCRAVISDRIYSTSYNTRKEYANRIMQIAFELADPELFGRSMALIDGEFSSSQISQIAKTISQHGLPSIRLSLNKIFQRGYYPTDNTLLFQQMGLLSNLLKEYQLLCKQQSQEPLTEVLEWQDITFNTMLSTRFRGSEADGRDLANALSDYPIKESLARTVAFLETKLENTVFIISFITSANDRARTGNLDKDAIENATSLRPVQTPYSWSSYCVEPITASRIAPDVVIKLIKLADATDNDITGIMGTLTEYSVNVKRSEMESAFYQFLFPVANGICEHIRTTKRPFTTGEQHFITTFLTSYVNGYVNYAPSPPADWKVKTTIQCICADCDSLRKFINDPCKKVEEFRMAERRRKHLDQQLHKSYFMTITLKQGTPYSLRVEKTQAMLVSSFLAWITRAQAAQAELKRLSQNGPLKEILGDKYGSIFHHKNLQIPDDLPVVPPVGGLTDRNVGNTVRSTIPSKRPFGR
ncbi:2OG-Fe(II) oxygenase [Aspergillus tanneri]|uniref:Uncharacterized protein n=1 Tax=Aspergillus tanneri TaxID=1220188 RepID=A0A5M9MNF9_9EURO|nr:uncharacterized protein ATNIH1004_005505 [Aspergillus tanneri]KAA8646830.1 hypothetical protein ATNIH1004_005505 [Aspergillus tanneri]